MAGNIKTFVCYTGIERVLFSFEIEWKIARDVIEKMVRASDSRSSPVYETNFYDSSWKLVFGYDSRTSEFKLKLELVKASIEEKNVWRQCDLAISSSNPRKNLKWINESNLELLSCSDHYLFQECYWQNDEITILVTVNLKVLKEEFTTTNKRTTPISYETIYNNLSQLLDCGILSDVTLKCHNESFVVHRNILCGRSEYFKGLFIEFAIYR